MKKVNDRQLKKKAFQELGAEDVLVLGDLLQYAPGEYLVLETGAPLLGSTVKEARSVLPSFGDPRKALRLL